MIGHRRHNEIDRRWWDHQLLRCGNRMWYAQSWVLDLTSPGWEALIDGSSGAIMPLTLRRKHLFKYLFQPYGTQQLGVFAPVYSDRIGERMLRAIPDEISYCDIALNEAMTSPLDVQDVTFSTLDQQVLPLDQPVEVLRAAYSTGHKRNLKSSVDAPPVIFDVTPSEFRRLFVETTAKRFRSGTPADHQMMERVIAEANVRGQCTMVGMRDGERLIAAATFMEWEGRAIFYKSAVAEEAMEFKPMFRIVDHFIEMRAGSGILLDLAGSATPSVARFNQGFGSISRVYLRLKRNDLPIPFKWLKQ